MTSTSSLDAGDAGLCDGPHLGQRGCAARMFYSVSSMVDKLD
jgi:hypothetical protein